MIEAIAQSGLLDPNGEIAIEHNPQDWNPLVIPNWEICREKVYGNTALTFYRVVD